jgi:hypothetical protein
MRRPRDYVVCVKSCLNHLNRKIHLIDSLFACPRPHYLKSLSYEQGRCQR